MTVATEFEWPEIMTRGGFTATRAQMQAAWERWKPSRGACDLQAALQVACGPQAPTRVGKYRVLIVPGAMRLADAMIQRARKAGIIRLGVGRKWERVE